MSAITSTDSTSHAHDAAFVQHSPTPAARAAKTPVAGVHAALDAAEDSVDAFARAYDEQVTFKWCRVAHNRFRLSGSGHRCRSKSAGCPAGTRPVDMTCEE
jgi:hypothetical protein